MTTARHLLGELTEKCKTQKDQDQKPEDEIEQKPEIGIVATPAVSVSTPLRKIIDRFTSELGDGVYSSSISTDQELMDLLDGLKSTVKKEEEEELNEPISEVPETKAPKIPRKRRNTAPLVSFSLKYRREFMTFIRY